MLRLQAEKGDSFVKLRAFRFELATLDRKKIDGLVSSAIIGGRYVAAYEAWRHSSTYGLKHLSGLPGLVTEDYAWLQANYPTRVR